MRKTLMLILCIAAASSVQAQLGEPLSECVKQFGDYQVVDDVYAFSNSTYRVGVYLDVKGDVIYAGYFFPKPATTLRRNQLLRKNDGDMEWFDKKTVAPNLLWMRTDGAVALFEKDENRMTFVASGFSSDQVARPIGGKPSATSTEIEIKKRAQAEWPNDYNMQAYEIKLQTDAFIQVGTMTCPTGMPTATFSAIKARAREEWPGDYNMQLYEIKLQIEGWREVNG